MKVIRLEAENIKRLVAVDITPDGNLVEITGKNGQGKTSVLDAIWWALAGGGAIQSQPIRKGEERARVKLDLGDLVITRVFNAQEDGTFTTSVRVENADGARYPSPQAMLDSLVGALALDPLEFARQSARGQFEELKQLTGLDFTALERANQTDFATRTVVNRRVRDLRAVAGTMTVPEDAPTERADEQELIDQLSDVSAYNDDIARRRANRERGETRIEAIQAEITTLTAEMHDIQTRLAAAPALGEPMDSVAIAAQLDARRAANRVFAQWEDRQRILGQADLGDAEAKALTEAMDKREQSKREQIAAAAMPVEGLGFGDGFVTLAGQPFEQASDAEQLRASVAIAAAANPKLKVIRVRDGSLLDEDSMVLLAGFAAEHDLQVWVETVQSGRPGSIRIEDGKVAEVVPAKKSRKAKAAGQEQLL